MAVLRSPFVHNNPVLTSPTLDRIVRNKTETDKNTSSPMGDCTSQKWTKRDRRNNQEQKPEQQEKKSDV